MKSFAGYEDIRAALPDWASDEVRQDSTGKFTLHDSVEEALLFWMLVKADYQASYKKLLVSAKVVDYGAGWGRMTRFIGKDVPGAQIFATDPNPIFADIYEQCRLPGRMARTDWLSAEKTGIEGADLLISFSIFTHASDLLV